MHLWPVASKEWVGIVDDDSSIRRSLARLLHAQGIQATTFASADEYFRHTQGSPCCLVVDIQLGLSTGLELRDRLLMSVSEPPPIIFISARDDLTALQRMQGHGVSAWLRKPVRADALMSAIHPHLRSSSMSTVK
ncbi:MAG: response regulator transcription factor [Gemmatimonadaceae bacterium]